MKRTIYSGFSNVASGITEPFLSETEITEIQSNLGTILEDDIISVSEKNKIFVNYINELNNVSSFLITRAGELSLNSSAITTEKNDLNTYLNSLTPVWNDLAQSTPVNRDILNNHVNALITAISDLQLLISREDAKKAVWDSVTGANKPEDNATKNTPRGEYSNTATYYLGDIVSWPKDSGGTGDSYIRIGTGNTTGTNPSDTSKWEVLVRAGEDALIAFLTNETHTLTAAADGTVSDYTGATGEFKIFSGTVDVSNLFTLTTVDNPQGLVRTLVDRTYTVTGGFDANEDVATWTIRATGSGAFASVTLDRRFTLSKSKQGATGTASKLISLTATHQVFPYDKTDTPIQQTATFTATKQNYAGGIRWYVYSLDGTSIYANKTTAELGAYSYFDVGTGDSVTMTQAQFQSFVALANVSDNGFILEVQLDDGSVVDKMTILKVKDGADGSDGVDGVDGVDGTSGYWREFVYVRSASPPTTPTGNGIPAPTGWFDDPPADNGLPLWMSQAQLNFDGTLKAGESWSTPVIFDGQTTLGWTPVLTDMVRVKNGFVKPSTSAGGFTSSVYSLEKWSGAYVSIEVEAVDKASGIGLSADPSITPDFNAIDYLLYLQNGTGSGNLRVYENGAVVNVNGAGSNIIGTYVTGDVVAISHENRDIVFYKNDVELYRLTDKVVPTTKLALDTIVSSPNTLLKNLSLIRRGQDGLDAYNGYLTNEAVALPSSNTGIVSSYVSATGEFKIEKGGVDVSSSFTLTTVADPQNLTKSLVNRTYTVSGGFDAGENVASWTIRATGSGIHAGVTIDKTFTLTKSPTGATGAAGQTGAKSTALILYKRSLTEPTLPSGNITYNFDTGVFTGLTNGWEGKFPATGGNKIPVWLTFATATGTGTTDTIDPAEWSAPVKGFGGISDLDTLDFADADIWFNKTADYIDPTFDRQWAAEEGAQVNRIIRGITPLSDFSSGNFEGWYTSPSANTSMTTSGWNPPTLFQGLPNVAVNDSGVVRIYASAPGPYDKTKTYVAKALIYASAAGACRMYVSARNANNEHITYLGFNIGASISVSAGWQIISIELPVSTNPTVLSDAVAIRPCVYTNKDSVAGVTYGTHSVWVEEVTELREAATTADADKVSGAGDLIYQDDVNVLTQVTGLEDTAKFKHTGGSSSSVISIGVNTLYKLSSDGWRDSVISKNAYTGGIRVSCTLKSTFHRFFMGFTLSFSGLTADSFEYTQCKYAVLKGSASYAIYEGGTNLGSVGGTPEVGDELEMTYYDGVFRLFINNSEVWSVVDTKGLKMAAFFSLHNLNTLVGNIDVGPIVDAEKIDGIEAGANVGAKAGVDLKNSSNVIVGDDGITPPIVSSTGQLKINNTNYGSVALEEYHWPMNYSSVTNLDRDWERTNTGSEVTFPLTDDNGGSSVQFGNNSGNDGTTLYLREWIPFDPNALYEYVIDYEFKTSGGSALFYAGLGAEDRLGNNLGASHNYCIAQGQPNTVGRHVRRCYISGHAAITALGGNSANPNPANPGGMPDGTTTGEGKCVRIRPLFLINYNGQPGQTIIHSVRLRKLSSALAAQAIVDYATQVGGTGAPEINADLTVLPPVGPASLTLPYTATNTPEWTTKTLNYTVSNLAGPITTGITYKYVIKTGTVNGFAASATERTMVVNSGTGSLELTSLGSDSAEVEIRATVGTKTTKSTLSLNKKYAETEPASGAANQGSQSSGFVGPTNSTYSDVSNVITVQGGAGTTSLSVNVNLTGSVTAPPNQYADSEVELQVLRRINSGSWVVMGSSETRTAFDDNTEVGGFEFEATWNLSRSDTVAVSDTVEVKIQGRKTSGTQVMMITGNVLVEA